MLIESVGFLNPCVLPDVSSFCGVGLQTPKIDTILGKQQSWTFHVTQTNVSLDCSADMAVGQNQWYHFGVAAPPIVEPILVGIESDVLWGYDLDFDLW